MADSVNALRVAAELNGNVTICAVPCNTFHAPKIWDRFIQRLQELKCDGSTLRVIHMLEETVKMIKEVAPKCKNIGLMSTTGTRQTKVYRNLLEPKGYTVTEVPEEQQVCYRDAGKRADALTCAFDRRRFAAETLLARAYRPMFTTPSTTRSGASRPSPPLRCAPSPVSDPSLPRSKVPAPRSPTARSFYNFDRAILQISGNCCDVVWSSYHGVILRLPLI